MSITDEYFQLTAKYRAQYGERTIVLLQVGAFFEVYGLKNPKTKVVAGSNITEFAQICQLSVSEKNVCVEQDHVVMAGFRDYTLEKYLQKLSENDYTSVVYTQTKEGKNVTRNLHAIYSAGTYVSYDNDSSQQITNHIMCIWLEKYQALDKSSKLLCGVATANIFTGKSEIFEYQTAYYMNPTTFDELERCVSTHCPSEVIILSTTLSQDVIQTIMQYVGIIHKSCHVFCASTMTDAVKNCTQQKYIHHILTTFFGEESQYLCAEFSNNEIATQAFCYLLHFIQEHNPDLVRKIEIPRFTSQSKTMLLANHTLKQLNIVDDLSASGKQAGQYSSVLSFLNKCASPMGRRLFQQQLIAPTFDQIWLQQEYDMTEIMLQPHTEPMISMLRKQLATIRDIEKICRQIVLRKIYPDSIAHLYDSLQTIQQIQICFAELPKVLEYLGKSTENIDQVLHTVQTYLQIDKCRGIQSVQVFPHSIIQCGVSPSLDAIIRSHEENLQHFREIHAFFNKIMRAKEGGDAEYVKIHTTDKSGVSLQITKKRAAVLKSILKGLADPKIHLSNGLYFCIEDVKFSSASTTNDEIEIPCLKNICKALLTGEESMNQEIAKSFQDFLTTFENLHLENLEKCALFVAKLDVLHCKAYLASNYNYCKPVIENDRTTSFVDARDLRHVLIEHIQINETYVPNDFCLNLPDQPLGVLLYGTNAVGKTSLIRALGIAVIMAQAGLYVPCSAFTYRPYCSIFSRILGNDNLFKGLSTFAVEMSELRMILRMADESSLILGDELCSGTETESALSIFTAGLLNLHAKGASFVFATHFHEILKFEEISQMHKLALKHMAVHYDQHRDCLVYDRKLQDGPGNRMYGLEVCKSLYLPEEFLQTALTIRNKYYPASRGELAHNTSTYNTKKIRGICELCKTNMGEEIHHLQPQKAANDKGFIGTVHKNHHANLMTLCEACHQQQHKLSITQKRKKTTAGYTVL